MFENGLWKFRYIIIIVVFALLVSSVIAFVLGIYSTYEAYHELSSGFREGHVASNIIVVYLIVYFFKNAVVLHFDTPLSLLYLSIGIVLIAVANYLSHKHKNFDKGEKGH